MRVKLVTLRFAPSLGAFDDRPLADFIRDKEVIAVREHFFSLGDVPHVVCLITYHDPLPTSGVPSERRPAAGRAGDGVELDAPERILFNTLREWRSSQARKDGVPPYVIFTNRELIAVIRARPTSAAALGAVPGIGAAKVERYGRAVLACLHGASAPPPQEPSVAPGKEPA